MGYLFSDKYVKKNRTLELPEGFFEKRQKISEKF